MKSLALILFFTVTSVHSFEKSVEEVGPCWASTGKELPLQYASFSSGQSSSLEKDDISEFLNIFKEKAKNLVFSNPLVIRDISLHCGAYGSKLIFALEESNPAKGSTYCLEAQKLKNGTWAFAWGLDPSFNGQNVCNAISPGELVLSKAALGENWQERLNSAEFKNVISDWHLFSDGHIKIVLNESYQGLENVAREYIQKSWPVEKNAIDYEYRQTLVGEIYHFPDYKLSP